MIIITLCFSHQFFLPGPRRDSANCFYEQRFPCQVFQVRGMSIASHFVFCTCAGSVDQYTEKYIIVYQPSLQTFLVFRLNGILLARARTCPENTVL